MDEIATNYGQNALKNAYDAGWQAHAAVAESEALKLRREAYQECAELACEGCKKGIPSSNHPGTGVWHTRADGGYWGDCYAVSIHAAIALLDLEIAKGGTPCPTKTFGE